MELILNFELIFKSVPLSITNFNSVLFVCVEDRSGWLKQFI